MRRIEDATEKKFGFRADTILRTAAEMQDVQANNPFDGREPSKLVVVFPAGNPGKEARERVRAVPADPEVLHLDGRELYIYYPNGQGRSKLSGAALDKALGVRGTARNWNTVTNLVKMSQAPTEARRPG